MLIPRHVRRALTGLSLSALLLAGAPRAMAVTPNDAGLDAVEKELAALVIMLDELPPMQIQAKLEPPKTTYNVGFMKPWATKASERMVGLRAIGFDVQSFGPDGVRWDADVTCGTWKVGHDPVSMAWDHPDGPPPACPHDQGTDHPGTITFSGKYSITIREGKKGNVNAPPGPIKYRIAWITECTYADGSKAGKADCTVTKDTGQGEAATASPSASPPPRSPGGAPAVGGAAAGAGLIFGGGYLYWRRRAAGRKGRK